MKNRIAIYTRQELGSDNLDTDLQRLRAVARDRDFTVVREIADGGAGSPRTRGRLPGLSALLRAVDHGDVDAVAVPTVAELGVCLGSLVEHLAHLHRSSVRLIVLDQPDAANEVGGDLTQAAAILLQARRQYRAEAVRAGQIRARAMGARFGRPPVSAAKIERVKTSLMEGGGVRQTARRIGISPAKVSQIKAEMSATGSAIAAS